MVSIYTLMHFFYNRFCMPSIQTLHQWLSILGGRVLPPLWCKNSPFIHSLSFLSHLGSFPVLKYSMIDCCQPCSYSVEHTSREDAQDMLGSSITSWMANLLFITILVLASFDNRSTWTFCSLGMNSIVHSSNSPTISFSHGEILL